MAGGADGAFLVLSLGRIPPAPCGFDVNPGPLLPTVGYLGLASEAPILGVSRVPVSSRVEKATQSPTQVKDLSPQVVPLRATVAVPELQLSTSWVDFGICFVNQRQLREVYLMNRSGCQSYWTVLMGQQEPAKDTVAFGVSPSSGLLEARQVNAPPTSITLQVFFTARSSELYESMLTVVGVLGEKACTVRLRGQGSYDEKYASPHQP